MAVIEIRVIPSVMTEATLVAKTSVDNNELAVTLGVAAHHMIRAAVHQLQRVAPIVEEKP